MLDNLNAGQREWLNDWLAKSFPMSDVPSKGTVIDFKGPPYPMITSDHKREWTVEEILAREG